MPVDDLTDETLERRSRQTDLDRWLEDLDARYTLDESIPPLIERQRAFRDAELRRAALTIQGTDAGSKLPADRLKRYTGHLDQAAKFEERASWLSDVAAEKRATLKVKEPDIYGPGSPHSYVLDHVHAADLRYEQHDAATERLARYARGVAFEARSGSVEGQRAVRAVRDQYRNAPGAGVAEVRALLSGGGITATSPGGMASFVTPAFLLDLTAPYGEYPPSLYMQTTQIPSPDYGLEFNVPVWSTPPSVAVQTEGAAASASTPAAELVSAPLATLASQIPVSQILADRAGAEGSEFDQFAFAQLQREYLAELDVYVIESAIANAGTVAFPTWSVPNFWGALGQAQAAIRSTAGTRLPATHTFMPDEQYAWLSTQVDSSNRPLFLPTPNGAYLPIKPGPDGTPAPGCTGERLLGSHTFTDGNIPAAGSDAQVIVANAAEIITTRTAPVLTVNPEPLAASLEVNLVFRSYVGALVRHPAAVQVVSGAGLPSAPTWA